MSQYYSLTDEEIEDSLQNKPSFIRTCPLGNRSKFSLIGVPAASIYSNPERISVIIDLLRNVGLSPVLYGSASCDEIQIYLFFDKELNTKRIADALKSLLTRCGLKLEENLIVYDEDSTVVFPLQQGFSWLNDSLQTKVCRDQISFESALAMFCTDMVKFESSVELLLEIHSRTVPVIEVVVEDRVNPILDLDIQEDFAPTTEPVISIIESELMTDELTLETELTPTNQLMPKVLESEDQIESVGLIDHVLSEEEIVSVQLEQIDFSPAKVIDMTPPNDAKPIKASKKQIKGLPYFADFTQLLLPIPVAGKSEPKKEKSVSARKSRRSKRAPPET